MSSRGNSRASQRAGTVSRKRSCTSPLPMMCVNCFTTCGWLRLASASMSGAKAAAVSGSPHVSAFTATGIPCQRALNTYPLEMSP